MERKEFTDPVAAVRYINPEAQFRKGLEGLDALADLLLFHEIGDGFVMVEDRKFVVYIVSETVQ